ncbi:MAG: DUF6265 family protein [Hyphomonadaceae bacterium]
MDDLAWLRGCWRTEAPAEAESGSRTTEVWIDPPGPAMIGYSFNEGEGEVQGWEQMRIDAVDGGRPRLVAMPGGASPVVFRMREQAQPTPGFAQFESPEHDYPQLIEYRRQGRRLTATISLVDGGNPYVYAYRRVACPASVRP